MKKDSMIHFWNCIDMIRLDQTIIPFWFTTSEFKRNFSVKTKLNKAVIKKEKKFLIQSTDNGHYQFLP